MFLGIPFCIFIKIRDYRFRCSDVYEWGDSDECNRVEVTSSRPNHSRFRVIRPLLYYTYVPSIAIVASP